MSELDDFLNARSTAKSNEQERIQSEREREANEQRVLETTAAQEWEDLRTLIRKQVTNINVDGVAIIEQGQSFLLKNVASTLHNGMLVNGVPRGLKISFGRSPYGSYFDEPLVDPETWPVEPTAGAEGIVWQVESGYAPEFLTSADLATKVIKQLVDYCDAYEAAYGR